MTDDLTARTRATTPLQPGHGLTRRQALRAGALAGAVVWTAPVVQALTMSPAAADTTSAPRSSKPKHPEHPEHPDHPDHPDTPRPPFPGTGNAYGRD